MKFKTFAAFAAVVVAAASFEAAVFADSSNLEIGASPDGSAAFDIDLTGFGAIPNGVQLPAKVPAVTRKIGELDWHVDYAAAYKQAREERKMLFIVFRDDERPRIADTYEKTVLSASELTKELDGVVRLVLPLGAMRPEADPEAERQTLLSHDSFKFMLSRQGIAMIDLTDPESNLHGQVVSAHPFTPGLHYTIRSTRIVLNLPKASVTQRALIYAVRLHPAAPISTTDGKCHGYLCKAARDSSQLMANYGSVGHHDWGTRYNDISVNTGRSAMEVAAMSGNQNLIAAAMEIVDQWYGSPSHWGILSTPAAYFGYDLVRDGSGNWWGTGLVAY